MKAVDIKWDVSGNREALAGLPTEIEIPESITEEDDVSDYLSDVTGFCHFGFELVD